MIKLYGLPVSNYYNVVKLAMLEKGVPFEEVLQRPNQDPSYLAISPLGKMPCVVTPEGPVAETLAILEY
ncbi:MAG: glutathione S-transferase family protein, partial [Candidatus Eremiobacteraeota bacterium]|nr:glutathione S-transferase family protein [Candidatus Eremiobacteraeota bacterium]